jgi:orotidine-5'-phosphate decarboxylase
MKRSLISYQQSVIVACDVGSHEKLSELVQATQHINGIGGYKVGFRLALRGLEFAVHTVKRHNPWSPVIFDGQKFGNDIPDLGPEFAKDLASCGIDAVIIFPFTGPETQRIWTEA